MVYLLTSHLHQSNRRSYAPLQNLIFTWLCMLGELGEASWKVFRRRTEQKSFPQEQGFEHSPKQVESMLKSTAELVKVIGGNQATSFWLCNPFPKHSHTTTLLQSSLSRNTSHGAVLRAGCLNQLIFFFCSVLDSESNLPSHAFSSHVHTVFPAGLVHSSLGWVVTSQLQQLFAPMSAAARAACLQRTQLRQFGGNQGSASQSDELQGLSEESASDICTLTQLELKSGFIFLSVSNRVNHRLPHK